MTGLRTHTHATYVPLDMICKANCIVFRKLLHTALLGNYILTRFATMISRALSQLPSTASPSSLSNVAHIAEGRHLILQHVFFLLLYSERYDAQSRSREAAHIIHDFKCDPGRISSLSQSRGNTGHFADQSPVTERSRGRLPKAACHASRADERASSEVGGGKMIHGENGTRK